MQRIYSIDIVFAGVIALVSIALGAAILTSVLATPQEPPVPEAMLIFGVFLLVNTILFVIGKGQLSFPWPRLQVLMTAIATGIFLTTAAYGIVEWPYAPVRPTGHIYVDKSGREHDEASFVAFKRWETAFLLLGTPFGLVALTSLPSSRRRSKGAI